MVLASSADASTLRLTSTADTSFSPGAQDYARAPGETFILELWVDATDTDVNGAEAHIDYDGTQIELLESSKAGDSFPPASAGINSEEDRGVFGDVMANNGVFAGATTDTLRYAAMTSADSTKANTRIARFLFQVRTGATTNATTNVTYKFTAAESTAITAANVNATNVLTGTDTGRIRIDPAPDTHIVLTAVSAGYTGAIEFEFVAIYNPTSDTVALTNYYLSDAHDVYFDTTSPAVASGDWVVRFPSAATIGPNDTITVALSAADLHMTLPGVHTDYEITSSNAGIPDMTIIATSGTRAFTANEVAILFYWDGSSVGVKDVDMLVYGTGVVPNKTGTAGHNADSASMTKPGTLAVGQIYRRTSFSQGDTNTNERKVGGTNGLTGHDETSESASVSWTWTSNDSMPWHTMLIAHKTGDYAAATAESLETGVEALRIKLKGARNTADTLTQIDLRTLGVADTENIDTVSLWIDANNDSIVSIGTDTLVGNFTALTAKTWRFTGGLAVPANSGHNLIVGFTVADTVQNGETVVMQIDTGGIRMSVSESGSFVALVNANAITLVKGVLKVTKLADIAASNFTAGTQNITVLSARITGVNSDTLTNIALDNLGALNNLDVSVALWRDVNSNLAYDVGDSLIAVMPYVSGTGRWELNGLTYLLPNGGDTVVWTISVFDTALLEGDTFQAVVPASSGDAVNAETGPALAVSNANFQRLINRPGIANHVVIAAAYLDDAGTDGDGEWILLYNPTDTPQNLQNWKISDAGVVDATLPDSTIVARGWFLLTDAAWVKDNASWPNADYLEAITLNNTDDGFSLIDSTGVVIDQFGYGATATDFESGTVANPGSTDIYVRRPHTVSVASDLLRGGRDEFGGAGYDSYDNAADFIRLTGNDTNSWTLRSSASASETAALKTTVVKIFSDVPNATRFQNETGITAAALFIQGDTSTSGTLTHFRVEATDAIADTNFTAINLYRDNNGDARWDAGDSLVATLPSIGGARWESTAMSWSFNSLAGETFLVAFNTAASVNENDTFQARIALRTVKASGADSGPTIVRTNTGVITLRNLNPIVVTKNANILSETVAPTVDTITVMAFRVRGNAGGDTLTRFSIENAGLLDTADIAQVRIWRDVDGDSKYSTGDALVATIPGISARRWETTSLNFGLGTGTNFVVTIDLGNAGNGDSFKAVIPMDGLNAVIADTGPIAAVTEPGIITVSTYLGVRVLITEVNVVSTPNDFIEVLVLDDGNGGAGVNMRDWKIAEPTGTDRKILGDTDNNGTSDTGVIVRTGERIIFIDAAGTDSQGGAGGIVEAYNSGLSFVTTDDVAVLYDPSGMSRDAVVWSNRDGSPTGGFLTDFSSVVSLGMWRASGDTSQNNAVTPKSGTSFTATLSIQRGGDIDRDTYLDWGEAPVTRGAANAMESPAIAPPRLTTVNLIDVPDDLGGSLRVSWTPDTSIGDFLEYRVYLETEPLDSLLGASNVDSHIQPRTVITDPSTGFVVISGLTDSIGYYAAVTMVDTYGLEFRFGLNDTGPVMPLRNITGTPTLLINEFFSQGTGATDTDYIEIYVKDDGNPSGNLNLSGWKIEWHSGGLKTIGTTTVTTGDYLLLTFNSSQSDDADSTGDGIANIYHTATGLVGGWGYVRVRTPSDTLVDFVHYAERSAAAVAAVSTAIRMAIDSGGWVGDTVNNSGVQGSRADGTFDATDILARDGASSDTTNSRDEWSVTKVRSKGAQNVGVEHPITVPDSRNVTILRDLPNDFGGAIEIGWDTTTSLGDFVRYNVYVETRAIGTRIDTSTFTPKQMITDSRVGLTSVSGLVNGETHWVLVTVTDSWGHEKRRTVNDSGIAVPLVNVTGTPVIRISEVWFAGSDTEFIELRVISDGNPTGSLNLSGFEVTNDDTAVADILTFGSVTVNDSDFIVLWNKPGTSETDSGGDGVVNIYNLTIAQPETDEGVFLIHPQGDTILDFVQWSNRSGTITAAEVEDINYAISKGAWAALGGVQNNARTPFEASDFNNFMTIARSRTLRDNNSDTDWVVDTTATPGALTNIAEDPFDAPAAVAGTDASDVPNDLGGQIRLTWTASGAGDLSHYNIYRETTVLPTSLYNTNLFPRDTAAKTDTAKVIGALTNGDTYWFAITAVDLYGNERKTALVVDSASPAANVSGETIIFTEVSFSEGAAGVNGYDWIELRVVGDGNNGAGIDLTGWKVVPTAGGNATKSLDGILARTGDYIVIHSTTGVDEANSGSDSVINLFVGATGLTATDNTLTLYRPAGDTEDFVAWTSPGGAPVNTADSAAILRAIATGHWTDFAPSGVGTEDGVNSDSVTANWSIARLPETQDSHSKNDWTFDSSPTPGARNDTVTYWRLTGTVDLESRAVNFATITASTGTETYVVVADASGSYALRVISGTYSIKGETTNYLRERITGITVGTASLLNQDVGLMFAGDANGDNRIDIFDASITKYHVDRGTNNAAADHVDAIGTANAADLGAVRNNFGRVGDP